MSRNSKLTRTLILIDNINNYNALQWWDYDLWHLRQEDILLLYKWAGATGTRQNRK